MTGFAQPLLLGWAAFLLLAVAGAGLAWMRRRRRAGAALADAGLLPRVVPGLASWPLRPLLWTAIAALLGVAAAGPLGGRVAEGGSTTLPDVVLVLDASNSMRVEDVRPSRLEVQRRLARELVRRLGSARVGLVVFAGHGYAVSPLTRDVDALDSYLDAMTPEMVPQGGSSLSNALRQGAGLLASTAAAREPGALVLMSDGDALEERVEVERVGGLLAQAGIPVHTVGIGTAAGGPIPHLDPETGRRDGFKREPDGRTARSVLGRPLLQSLAQQTRGSYATAGEGTADRLMAALPVDGRAGGSWNESRPGHLYPWLVGLALLLLAADSWVAARRGTL